MEKAELTKFFPIGSLLFSFEVYGARANEKCGTPPARMVFWGSLFLKKAHKRGIANHLLTGFRLRGTAIQGGVIEVLAGPLGQTGRTENPLESLERPR